MQIPTLQSGYCIIKWSSVFKNLIVITSKSIRLLKKLKDKHVGEQYRHGLWNVSYSLCLFFPFILISCCGQRNQLQGSLIYWVMFNENPYLSNILIAVINLLFKMNQSSILCVYSCNLHTFCLCLDVMVFVWLKARCHLGFYVIVMLSWGYFPCYSYVFFLLRVI